MDRRTKRRGAWVGAGLAGALAVGAMVTVGWGGPAGPAGAAGAETVAVAGRPPAAAAPAALVRTRPEVRRPNVLLITVDDMRVGDLRYMPHLDRLVADQGVTFTDALAPTPICVPARASLLTGQYTHNHRAYTIEGRGGGFAAFDDRRTLPVAMRRAGYDTLFIGKYLNGYGSGGSQRYVPPGWTSWQATVGGSTYNYLRPVLNDNGHLRQRSTYSTDLLNRLTQQQLSKPVRTRKPWYLWVNYVAPHHGGPVERTDPRARYPRRPELWVPTPRPADRDRARFPHVRLPQTPNLFDGPTGVPSVGRPVPRLRKAMIRYAHRQRLQSLQAVDRSVRDTVATLKRTGQWRRTVVLFTSDNGYLIGQMNRVGKLLEFDDSVRIPVVAAGPGIPRGATVRGTITNPDIAVTIAEYARTRIGRRTDGTSFRPLLRLAAAGDTRRRVRPVPLEAYPVGGGTRPIYRGVREGRYTYVRYRRGGVEVLFDRGADRYEMVNRARDPRYRAVLAHYRRLAATLADCRGYSCDRTYSLTLTAPPVS